MLLGAIRKNKEGDVGWHELGRILTQWHSDGWAGRRVGRREQPKHPQSGSRQREGAFDILNRETTERHCAESCVNPVGEARLAPQLSKQL